MNIKRENNTMIMSQILVCKNYLEMKHYTSSFEKVGDNEYKCICCGEVMVIKEPVLVLDDKFKLKMEVSAEPKQ